MQKGFPHPNELAEGPPVHLGDYFAVLARTAEARLGRPAGAASDFIAEHLESVLGWSE